MEKNISLIASPETIDNFFLEACNQYEKSAPMVHSYLDDLYIRIHDKPESVVLSELTTVARLLEDGIWEHPNFAQNRIYHLMERLGRQDRGVLSF